MLRQKFRETLSKQINDRTAAGVSTDDVQKAFDNLFATLESEEFKTQMKSDFESAQAEFSKIAQDPLKYKTITVPQRDTSSVSSTTDKTPDVEQEEKKPRTLKVTTTEDRNTTTQVETTVETTGGGFTTVTRPKTEKTVLSENGFTSQKSQITERFMIATERENLKEYFIGKNHLKDIKMLIVFLKLNLNKNHLKLTQ